MAFNSNQTTFIPKQLAMVVLLILALFFALSSTELFAANRNINIGATGKNVTKNIEVSDFSELSVSGVGDVTIKKGERPSVSITADGGGIDKIEVSATGGKLTIENKSWSNISSKVDIIIVTNQPLNKIVTGGAVSLKYKNINGDKLDIRTKGSSDSYLSGKVNSLIGKASGSSEIDAGNLMISNKISFTASGASEGCLSGKGSSDKMDSLVIEISGSSHVKAKDLKANKVSLQVSGASDCYLSGEGNSLQIKEAGGSSSIKAKEFMANEVSVKVSGASDVTVYAKSSLEVEASGASDVSYRGNPQNVVRESSGTSSIRKID